MVIKNLLYVVTYLIKSYLIQVALGLSSQRILLFTKLGEHLAYQALKNMISKNISKKYHITYLNHKFLILSLNYR